MQSIAGKLLEKKSRPTIGKKREVVEKIINYLARQYEEDLARYQFGKLLEENHSC